MARRRLSPEEAGARRRLWAAQVVAQQVGAMGQRRRVIRPQELLERAAQEARELEWSEWRPAHVVAQHAYCHRAVYRVEEQELRAAKTLKAALGAAGRLVQEQGAEWVVRYLRWIWQREREQEQRRRAEPNGSGGRRLTWRLVFAARYLVTDYKVALARQAEQPGGGRSI